MPVQTCRAGRPECRYVRRLNLLIDFCDGHAGAREDYRHMRVVTPRPAVHDGDGTGIDSGPVRLLNDVDVAGAIAMKVVADDGMLVIDFAKSALFSRARPGRLRGVSCISWRHHPIRAVAIGPDTPNEQPRRPT